MHFLWIAQSIAGANIIVANNDAKTFLAEETPTSISGAPNLLNKAPRKSSKWFTLEIFILLNYVSNDIMLEKTFPILAFCLVDRDNSWDNSQFWNFIAVVFCW